MKDFATYRYLILMLIIFTAIGASGINFTTGSLSIADKNTSFTRSTTDRQDESQESSIHFMYVIPSDGFDAQLDVAGMINRSVYSFQLWLAQRSGGWILRPDTYNDGILDITFYRLNRTDAQMQEYGAWVVTEIEKELKVAGFNDTNKIYSVYYGGGSTYACGGAAWPPYVPGQYVAMYLLAEPPGFNPPCSAKNLTNSVNYPGYWELAMLHDLFHALGAVSTDAPNHHLSGHVSDSNTDLMYSGSLPWNPSTLDYGKNDYYQHENSEIVDIEDSTFLTTNHSLTDTTQTTTSQGELSSTAGTSTTSTKTDSVSFVSLPLLFSFGIIILMRKRWRH